MRPGILGFHEFASESLFESVELRLSWAVGKPAALCHVRRPMKLFAYVHPSASLSVNQLRVLFLEELSFRRWPSVASQ